MDEKLRQAVEELRLGKNVDQNFEYIYSATKESTIRVIRHFLPSDVYKKTDVSILEMDLLQEVYVAVFKYIKTLNDVQSFPAWLGKITANTVMTYLRKNGNVLKMSSLDEEDENGNTIEPEDFDESKRPEIIAMKKTEAEVIMAFVDELPPAQRDALIAFYGEDLKIKDIAEASGVSENTIKTRLHYAKKALYSRKSDFKKHGIDLVLIPFAVLIHSAYKADTTYAMGLIPGVSEKLAEYGTTIVKAAIGASAGSAGAAGASAASAASGTTEVGSVATGGAVSTSTAGVGAAAATKAVGASVAVKATIAVAAVASATAVGGTAYKVSSDAKAETAMVQEQGDFANSSLDKKEIKEYQNLYIEALDRYVQDKHLSMKNMSIQFIDVDGDGIPEMYVHTGWKGIKAVVFSENEGTTFTAVESLDDSVGFYKGDNVGYVLTRHIKDDTQNISAHAAAISAYNLYMIRDGVGQETIKYYVDEYDGSRTSCALNGEFITADVASEVMEEFTSGLDYSFIDPAADTAMSYNELRASAGLPELSDEELDSYVVHQAMYADALQEYANKTEKSLDNAEIVFADVDNNGFPEMFVRIDDQKFPDDDRYFIYSEKKGEIQYLAKWGKAYNANTSYNDEDFSYNATVHMTDGPRGYITLNIVSSSRQYRRIFEISDDNFDDILDFETLMSEPGSSYEYNAYVDGEEVDYYEAYMQEEGLYKEALDHWSFGSDDAISSTQTIISYNDLLAQYTNSNNNDDAAMSSRENEETEQP